AELLARHVDEDPAPVAVAERERRPGRRRKRERRIESLLRPAVDRELELRSERRRAGGERVVDAVAVLDGDRLLRRDGQRLLPAREQDPDRGRGRLGERRARVVGREDLVVRVALLRVALGSPLTHPHAVPVAVAADEEEGSGLRRGDIVRTGRGRRVRRRREQNRGDTGGEGGERANQQALRVASRPSGGPVKSRTTCEATEPRRAQKVLAGAFRVLGGRMAYVESRNRATSSPETRREVLAEIESRGIEDVLLWFTDLEGHLK